MSETYTGISLRTSPFITSILAPQLKMRGFPMHFAESLEELSQMSAAFSILDGDSLLEQQLPFVQKLTATLRSQTTNIAFTLNKGFKHKLALLELGFKHCLELPVAPEIIVKTIENSLSSYAHSNLNPPTTLRENSSDYAAHGEFDYMHNSQGQQFLVNKTKSIYITPSERGILEYLLRRKGFASINELAYAGWKHFDIRPNTVTVTIKKLRRKLSEISSNYRIRSLYGYGYIIEEKGDFKMSPSPEYPAASLALQ